MAALGLAQYPQDPRGWVILIAFVVGSGICGHYLLPGTALVLLGLVTSLTVAPDDVSAAGLCVFIPIFAAFRRSSRFAVPITVVVFGLGFYVMIIHSSDGRPILVGAAVLFLIVFALTVGAGLFMRASHRQIETERRRADEQLSQLRLNLARELHDNAVHKISQAAMRANIQALSPQTRPELVEELTSIATLCNDAAHELRLLLAGLRQEAPKTSVGQPQIIDAGSLTLLIEGQADRLAALGFAVTQDLRLEAPTSLQCRTLAAVAVEAVNNIVQHAPAKSDCSIRVFEQTGAVVAEFTNRIRDPKRATSRPSFGLLGIEERARAIGGFITISKPAGQWRLLVTLPAVPGIASPDAPEVETQNNPSGAIGGA